jgi:hypothetical protein
MILNSQTKYFGLKLVSFRQTVNKAQTLYLVLLFIVRLLVKQTLKPDSAMVDDTTLGYIGVSIAVIFFGSYAVPVKLIKTGDGVFFQWVSDLSQIQRYQKF